MAPGMYPRDKEELLREFDALQRLGDVQRGQRLKARLAPRWWEAGITLLLFASALGLLASLFQYSDVREEPINSWLLFWFSLTILTVVMTFEFLLFKIFSLRRSNDIQLRMIEDLRARLDNLDGRLKSAAKANDS